MADIPKDPDRFDPDRHVARNRDALSMVGLAAVLIACSLVVSVVLFAVNRGDEPVTTASSPPVTTSSPPATTGQSQENSQENSDAMPDKSAPEPKANPAPEPKAK